jgi:hypothetical protein
MKAPVAISGKSHGAGRGSGGAVASFPSPANTAVRVLSVSESVHPPIANLMPGDCDIADVQHGSVAVAQEIAASVAADLTRAGNERHSHVIYSDHRGETWQIGGIAENQTNESAVAELKDGSLLLNEAFAQVTGRCSAADAESLGRLRRDRQYKEVSRSWDEFCTQHLGISKRQADRTIRLLDEYWPSYFAVAQMAHGTPDEYRAIAPHVSADALNVNGAAIALIPENSAKVAAGVAELLKRERPAKGREAISADLVLSRFDAVADMLGEVQGLLNIDQQIKLAATLRRMEAAAARCGLLTV